MRKIITCSNYSDRAACQHFAWWRKIGASVVRAAS